MRRFEHAGYKLIETDDGHWLATYTHGRGGKKPGDPVLKYGTMTSKREYHTHRRQIHRALFEIQYGAPIGSTRLVRTCTHQGCVKPDHWNFHAVFTPADIDEVRARILNGENQIELAREYGVTKRSIDDIAMKIRKEQGLYGTKLKTSAPYKSDRNPFWIAAKDVEKDIVRLWTNLQKIHTERQERARRNERSSASALDDEIQQIQREIADRRRQRDILKGKASRWHTLNQQANELGAKTSDKPNRGRTRDEADRGPGEATRAEFAQMLGIKPRTLSEWVQRGHVPEAAMRVDARHCLWYNTRYIDEIKARAQRAREGDET